MDLAKHVLKTYENDLQLIVIPNICSCMFDHFCIQRAIIPSIQSIRPFKKDADFVPSKLFQPCTFSGEFSQVTPTSIRLPTVNSCDVFSGRRRFFPLQVGFCLGGLEPEQNYLQKREQEHFTRLFFRKTSVASSSK